MGAAGFFTVIFAAESAQAAKNANPELQRKLMLAEMLKDFSSPSDEVKVAPSRGGQGKEALVQQEQHGGFFTCALITTSLP
jgi:hypothetical protein